MTKIINHLVKKQPISYRKSVASLRRTSKIKKRLSSSVKTVLPGQIDRFLGNSSQGICFNLPITSLLDRENSPDRKLSVIPYYKYGHRTFILTQESWVKTKVVTEIQLYKNFGHCGQTPLFHHNMLLSTSVSIGFQNPIATLIG